MSHEKIVGSTGGGKKIPLLPFITAVWARQTGERKRKRKKIYCTNPCDVVLFLFPFFFLNFASASNNDNDKSPNVFVPVTQSGC